MLRIFGRIISGLLMTFMVAALIPILYFAWQLHRPLSHPDFKGMSYVEYMQSRKAAEEQAISSYFDSHAGFEYQGIGTPMTACYTTDVVIFSVVGPLQSFGYTLAAWMGQEPDPLHPLPTQVKWLNFPAKWWETFEYLFWYNEIFLGKDGEIIPYCLQA